MGLKSYKYRIYPTKDQETLLSKTFGCVRYVWNYYTEIFNSYSCSSAQNPTYTSTTILRSQFEWLKEVNAAALQQKERDFKTFKNNYFSKTRKTKVGVPSFKKKSSRQSFRLPNQKFYLTQNTIHLEKIGNIKIILNRLPNKNCKYISVTVSKTPSGKYYAAILVDENIIPRFINTEKSIGIDLGLKDFLIISNGEKIKNPRWFRKNQAKLKKTQKSLSRKVKGSCRYKKTKTRIARLYEKISNQKNWFHHNLSLDLIRRFDFIGIETLNICGMIKNRKLAKSISDVGWSQFIIFLKYKAAWNHKKIQQIEQWFPSSKTCNVCGCINDELKLSDRIWECMSCHSVLDRDINAAINIEKIAKLTAQEVACALRAQSQNKTWTTQAIDNEASKKLDVI